MPNRRAAIVGVATSDYPNLPDMSEHQVHAQAAERALADAGLEFGDVDGFATAGNFPMYAVGVCEYLGLQPLNKGYDNRCPLYRLTSRAC